MSEKTDEVGVLIACSVVFVIVGVWFSLVGAAHGARSVEDQAVERGYGMRHGGEFFWNDDFQAEIKKMQRLTKKEALK